MAALSYSTIFDVGWKNIFDLIKAIPDPEDRGGKFIYGTFPKVEDITRDNYPMIRIAPVNITRIDNIALKNLRDVFLSIEIIVLAVKPENLDTLSDDIFEKIEDSETTLFGYKMKNQGIIRSSNINFERGGLRVHRRSMVFEFQFDYA